MECFDIQLNVAKMVWLWKYHWLKTQVWRKEECSLDEVMISVAPFTNMD